MSNNKLLPVVIFSSLIVYYSNFDRTINVKKGNKQHRVIKEQRLSQNQILVMKKRKV